MSDDPSIGELLAGFGDNTDMLTDYFNGQIDEDGMPTEYYDGPEGGPVYETDDDSVDAEDDVDESAGADVDADVGDSYEYEDDAGSGDYDDNDYYDDGGDDGDDSGY